MFLAADAATQAAQQVNNVPTFVAAIVTALSLPVATVFVAYISRRGDRRTAKSDNIPDIIKILEEGIIARDKRIDGLVEDRDAWRAIAWRQVNESETATDDAFVTRRINREVHIEPDK